MVQQLGIDEVAKYYEFKEEETWYKKKAEKEVKCTYLLMENVEGIELIDFFNNALTCQRRLNENDMRYVFTKVTIALHKLHRAGIAHRDIKPENIMITEDYKIKLIDIGYGIPLSGREGTYLMNTRRGTPTYMAPEIIQGKPYQGADIDLFSLGVMLITLRTMKYPFNSASSEDDPQYAKLMANETT